MLTANVKAALLAIAALVIFALLLAYISSLNIQTITFDHGVPLHS